MINYLKDIVDAVRLKQHVTGYNEPAPMSSMSPVQTGPMGTSTVESDESFFGRGLSRGLLSSNRASNIRVGPTGEKSSQGEGSSAFNLVNTFSNNDGESNSVIEEDIGFNMSRSSYTFPMIGPSSGLLQAPLDDINEHELNSIFSKSVSIPNFACNLMLHMFSQDELTDQVNVTGLTRGNTAGRRQLDPLRIELIKHIVFQKLDNNTDKESEWKKCIGAMHKKMHKLRQYSQLI